MLFLVCSCIAKEKAMFGAPFCSPRSKAGISLGGGKGGFLVAMF